MPGDILCRLACVLFGNLKHIGRDVIDGDVMPVFGKFDTDLRQACTNIQYAKGSVVCLLP